MPREGENLNHPHWSLPPSLRSAGESELLVFELFPYFLFDFTTRLWYNLFNGL